MIRTFAFLGLGVVIFTPGFVEANGLYCQVTLSPSEAMEIPEPIPKSSDVVVLPGELDFAGTFVKRKRKLQLDRDGMYIYLIDPRRQVLVSHFTPNLKVDISHPEARHFATHRSLLNTWTQANAGVPPDIVGAGEFHLTNGRLSRVNNFSNTFRGALDHLYFSTAVLREVGLPLESQTHLVNWVEGKINFRKHIRTEAESRLLIFHMKNRRRLALRNRLVSVYRKLASYYPHPTIPGYFNVPEVASFFPFDVEDERSPNDVIHRILWLMNKEGLDATIDSYDPWSPEYNDYVPEPQPRLRDVLPLIEAHIATLGG